MQLMLLVHGSDGRPHQTDGGWFRFPADRHAQGHDSVPMQADSQTASRQQETIRHFS
jgi:hypothetical protein